MSIKIIEYNLDFYIINQDLYEPDQLFYERVWLILSNYKSKNPADFDKLVKNSIIKNNQIYFECEYIFSGRN